MKNLFQRGKRFVFESAVHLFVALFGLVWFTATLLDKTFPPQQVLVWQALGLTIAGTGIMRLIDLWWGMDANKRMLDELTAQRTEIQALRAELTSMNDLLERRLEQSADEHLKVNAVPQNGQQPEIELQTTPSEGRMLPLNI